ncbi:Zeatin O-glucosyltransferase [Camellia lanceoleosa]|uniref:Zeatin O-glucosyltransferase n=1 Tax=Camellia lanceoleosa TaxID=1840588 RepID=A0ACC0FTS1_9ERIC|nr:Zeatin O-glucosyltransferase [Camellia lanceoleosa]
MVPFPAQGHLNQLLQLSRLLSSSSYHHHIPIHYVGCAAHNRQAKLRVHGWDPISSSNNNNIHFHDFPNPHFLSPPPNPNASIKFPLTSNQPSTPQRSFASRSGHFYEHSLPLLEESLLFMIL